MNVREREREREKEEKKEREPSNSIITKNNKRNFFIQKKKKNP